MAKKNNGKKVDAAVSNVVVVDLMDVVRAGLTKVRGLAPTPTAVAAMTEVLVAGGVKIEPVMNRAVVGGFNVTGFQNALYVCNARDGWHFSDAELAIAWAACLPANNARVGKDKGGFITDPTKYVGGTRTLFNAGKHGVTPNGYPVIKSMRYLGAKAPAPVVPTPQPVEAPAPQPTEALEAATV